MEGKRNKRKRKGTPLLLGVMEDKAYCGYVGEHSQRNRSRGKFRVYMTRLSCAMWGEGGGEGEERREPGAVARKEGG